MYCLDAEGRITFINPAGARRLGGAPDELLGAGLRALLHRGRADLAAHLRDKCPLERSLRSGAAARSDAEALQQPDGSSFAAELAVYPLARDGRGAGLAG